MKLLLSLFLFTTLVQAKPMVVASKKFTESVILGEILRLGLKDQGQEIRHQRELGATALLWDALLNGDIDLYPEYTGTIQEEIFRREFPSVEELRTHLKEKGIGLSLPLGFNNTYAIGMLEERATALEIKTISDLRSQPSLRFGWADDFMERKDGWPGIRKTYQLPHTKVRGIDHDIAYRALVTKDIDVMDLYSTDAEIPYYKIRILEDDRSFFPHYDAVILYRLDKEKELKPLLDKLTGKITEAEMSEMNRLVKIERKTSTEVAAQFLKSKLNTEVKVKRITWKDRIFKRSLEHFKMVFLSMLLAILVAIPLGVVAAKKKSLGNLILMVVSTLQTIPALALLVLLIKPLNLLGLPGIGDTPAIIALFLYSLLPILRNTHAGITQIPKELQETASVLNLSRKTRLRKIEFPLALPLILAGIKTSLVMNIGFATLGALVGAGGYGQSILTGIRLDDYQLILEGALPAALLAILAQKIFDLFEK